MIVKGQKVNDRYEILQTIGEGGMANVYLANDTILNRNVAIKVLRGDLASDDKFVRRFQREALSASSLSHPNIVEIYDVGEDNGDYYIVMEYIPGMNLKQLIKKRGSLTVPEVIDIMLQITSGMTVAHDAMIIHRDLKPQNIIIMDDGGIKITDFGIAMAINSTQITQTNSAMGSVHYFPPEQANGKGSTLKSDVYSLGIMMYELLSGVLPFRGDNAVEIALKHLKEPIKSVKEEVENIPQSVENVIIRATAKNPKNRYGNAHEMHDDLLTILDKDRLNEPKIELKFSEGALEEASYIDKNSDMDSSIVKEIKSADNDTKQKKIIIILSSIFGFLALVLATIFIILPMFNNEPDITIPDVSNLTILEAETKLKKLGFEIGEQNEETSDSIEEGKVIGTMPGKGSSRKKGTKISLVVSTGIIKWTVEDLTGKNSIEYKTRLTDTYKLIVTIEEKSVVQTNGKEYDPQEIVGQSVTPGEVLKAGDEIILYVPKVEEKYPDMVKENWSIAQVEDWCEKREIKLTITYQETSDLPAGTIISQSRGSGTIVVKGANLTVVFSKERVETIPDQEGVLPD